MKYRALGSTGFKVSEVSFGAWAVGGTWGAVQDEESMAAMHRALDLGVNFFDTADVYGDGHSERLIARLRRERPSDPIMVATKAGRRLAPHTPEGYTLPNLAAFVDRSRENLQMEVLDLVQLHCPPTAVYSMPSAFEALDTLKERGKIAHYGVSVEKVDEAIKALEYPGVESVQIVFNIFRQKPADTFFELAARRSVGIIARLPLSSGMLSGKMQRETRFESGDHRSFNRNGEAFDKGETFSGIDYDLQLEAVEELRALIPAGMTMAELALRWILNHPEVSCAIPGAKRKAQVDENCSASQPPSLSPELVQKVRKLYETRIRDLVHGSW